MLQHILTEVEGFEGSPADAAWSAMSERLRHVVKETIPSSAQAESLVQMALARIDNSGYFLSDADFFRERIDLCECVGKLGERRANGEHCIKNADVFLVFGRDKDRTQQVKDLLRCIGVVPMAWEKLVEELGSGSPTVWDVVLHGIYSAQSIVVLLTPDEKVLLREELIETPGEAIETFQPRPNVLIELGIALGERRASTIVLQYPNVREVSDIQSINTVRIDGKVSDTKNFLARLQSVGHNIQWTQEWQRYILK